MHNDIFSCFLESGHQFPTFISCFLPKLFMNFNFCALEFAGGFPYYLPVFEEAELVYNSPGPARICVLFTHSVDSFKLYWAFDPHLLADYFSDNLLSIFAGLFYDSSK